MRKQGVFGHFSLWPLNMSKPKLNRNRLLKSLWGRSEVMQGEEGVMMGRERWRRKWGRCRVWVFLVIHERLCTPRCNPLAAYEYCNCGHCLMIHGTLTYFWFWGEDATWFCFESVSKSESGQFPISGKLSTMQTLGPACGVHVYMVYPLETVPLVWRRSWHKIPLLRQWAHYRCAHSSHLFFS